MSRAGAALLLALALASPSAAKLRAVFVGIDHYEYSRARLPGALFDDLSGAVGDTLRIKAALNTAYGLRLDEMPNGQCQSINAVSVTLTNACATKANILAAWDNAIRTTARGDTLILYFAGHGSRFIDSEIGDQASGYNSTLMAHDARQPGAPAGADILDHEVRDRIDAATSRGIRVVTWFDSCNSGTASRDGRSASRTAPDLRTSGLRPQRSPQQYGSFGAYRVHIGAAGDGQDAKEVGTVGNRAGVFTTALAAALVATPRASFADLAARVVTDVATRTQRRQVPHAEGALRATLDGPEIRVPTLDVALDSSTGRLVMAGGGLIGVTPGSRYAVFPSTAAALQASGGQPLLTARVAQIYAGTALLTPDGPLPADVRGRLVAREIAHEFGGRVLGLATADPQARTVAAKLGFVADNPQGPFALEPSANGLTLRGRGGVSLAALPSSSDPDFGVRLASALEKIARVERWLALVQPRGGTVPAVSLCVQTLANPADFVPAQCPPDDPVLKLLQPAMIGVVNNAPAPRFVYVLAVGRNYEVTLVMPAFGAVEPALQPGQTLTPPPGQRIRPDEVGDLRFVVLASDQPLNATALEQAGTDVVDLQACLSPVAQAFCLGANRARAGGWPQVRDWSVTIVNTNVVP
jgi:hypothetical protein